jgi:hypothetical protein
MALGLNKIIVSGAQVNTAGAYLTTTTIAVAASGNTVVPAGTYLVFPTANVTIEAATAYNASNGVTTWAVLLGNNTGGVMISDGVNVRANAIVATAANITVATVNGGQAVTGQFNT